MQIVPSAVAITLKQATKCQNRSTDTHEFVEQRDLHQFVVGCGQWDFGPLFFGISGQFQGQSETNCSEPPKWLGCSQQRWFWVCCWGWDIRVAMIRAMLSPRKPVLTPKRWDLEAWKSKMIAPNKSHFSLWRGIWQLLQRAEGSGRQTFGSRNVKRRESLTTSHFLRCVRRRNFPRGRWDPTAEDKWIRVLMYRIDLANKAV